MDLGKRLSRVEAQLAHFEKREPLVRSLIGAIEDRLGDACPEWRAVVDWEMDNTAPSADVARRIVIHEQMFGGECFENCQACADEEAKP